MRYRNWFVIFVLFFLVAVQSFGQDSLRVEELKRPGDPVRILVHFNTAQAIESGSAILERRANEGECHVPQAVPLKGQIICSTIEKITETEYLFSGAVENNATGWYKLTKVLSRSDGKEKQYVWGHDFDGIVRIVISNPQEKQCVQ